jgi:predicted MFS family arabinose efflux permease
MAGRALLGVAVGGYWSISAAIVMRLVPIGAVSKALAILNGGNAAATVVAAPLGSYLGSIIGWRGAFFCVVPVAILTFFWQWRSLPKLPAPRAEGTKAPPVWTVFGLFRMPVFAAGMAAGGLLFLGQFMLFTYLRPFLDTVTGQDAQALSGMLLIMGLSGVAGTVWIGKALRTRMYSLLIAFPALMAGTALALVASVQMPMLVLVLLGIWGFLGTSVPVAWWTWMAQTLPDDAETGGGLLVAVIQLAIALGAVIGGVLFDTWGYQATFDCAALVLISAAILGRLTQNLSRRSNFTSPAQGV